MYVDIFCEKTYLLKDFFMFFSFYIIFIFIYYSSWAKTLEKFTNIVNLKSQLSNSTHLLAHLQILKHHRLSN